MNTRKAIFDLIRAEKGRIDPDDVAIIDGALDRVGIAPSEDEAPRQISQRGVDLIKSFEGLELTAYVDPVGVLTIGYGSTGAHVKPGMTITPNQAEKLLRDDLTRFEACVDKAVSDLSDNRFAACVSLAFNIGCDAFKGSSVCRFARAGDHGAAQRSFALWNKASGRVLPGLVRRRAAEAELYAS
jgi:lysozyme